MERRVLLAVILSMAVLYAYQAFIAPPPDQQKPTQPASAGKPAAPKPAPETSGVAAAPALPAPQTLVAETGERDIVVDTADVQAVLTNRGARLIHWRLKHYFDDQGTPVDLIPSAVPGDQPSPFALRLDDAQMTERV
jgi:YidC/Oxa1 family membrane protein insertase